MNTAEELKSAILRMDHRGYPAYKSLAGSWRFPEYILNIDHVQGDPFASPSSLSVRIDGKRAGFPAAFLETRHAAGPWRTPWSGGSRERRGGLRSGRRAPERADSLNPAVRDRRSWSGPHAG